MARYFNSATEVWSLLSNFSAHPITWKWKGSEYRAATTEHAFVWAKFHMTDPMYALRCLKAGTPGRAKRLGRDNSKKLDPRWDLPHGDSGRPFKVVVMKQILRLKAQQNPEVLEALMKTGDEELVEYAPWGDRFWGINKEHVGQNWLGRLWMEIRAEHKKKGPNDE